MGSTFRIAMAVAALAASGAAQAQPNAGFCADLQEVVAAGRETPPFGSLPNWSTYGRPMLAFELCGASPDLDRESLYFLCTRYDPARLSAPPGISVLGDFDLLVSRVETCLPRGTRATVTGPDPDRPRMRRMPGSADSRSARFDLDGTALEIILAVTPRTTELRLEAYDIAARAAWRAAQAERWRRAREEADSRD